VGKCIDVDINLNGSTEGLIVVLQMKHFDAGGSVLRLYLLTLAFTAEFG
jgi:hypothetical protein